MTKLKNLSRDERREVIVAAAITAMAFAHALFYVLKTLDVEPYIFDGLNYLRVARGIVTKGMFSFWGKTPDAYITPAYPLFLAAFMAIFGDGQKMIIAVRLTQCVMVAATCALTYRFTRRLTGKMAIAVIAAAFTAMSGAMAYYSVFMMTETLWVFLVMIAVNLYLDLWREGGTVKCAVCGAVFALAILTRPPIACLIPFAFGFLLWEKRWRDAAILAAGMIVPLAPWWIRNIVSVGEFIPFCTQTNAFFHGFCEDPEAMGLEDPGTIWGNLAYVWQFIKDDPLGMANYMTFGKFRAIFMSAEELTWNTVKLSGIDYIVRAFGAMVGTAGAVLALWSKKYRRIAAAMLVFLALTFLVVPVVRYGFVFYPFLGTFAGIVLTAGYEKFKNE